MKRILVFMLALLAAVSVTSCSGKSKKAEPKKEDDDEIEIEITNPVIPGMEEAIALGGKAKEGTAPEAVTPIVPENSESVSEISEPEGTKLQIAQKDEAASEVPKVEEVKLPVSVKEETKTENIKSVQTTDIGDTNDQVVAEAVVHGFMRAVCDFDIKAMSGYCNVDIIDNIGFDSLKNKTKTLIENLFGADGDESLAVQLGKLADSVVDAMTDNASYEITSSSYSDGMWIFDVKFSAVKFADIKAAFTEEALEQVTAQVTAQLLLKYSDKDIKNMTEQETAVLMSEIFVEIINEMADRIEEAADNAVPSIGNCRVVTGRENGKWLINIVKSDINAFKVIIGKAAEVSAVQ